MHLPFAALAIALQLSAATPGTPASPPEAPTAARAVAPAPETAAASGELDVSAYPPEQRARYALLQEKCSKCHSIAVALGSPPTAAVWSRHRRRSGMTASAEQAREIDEFLRFEAAQRAAGTRVRARNRS